MAPYNFSTVSILRLLGNETRCRMKIFAQSHSRLLRLLGDEAQTHQSLHHGGTDSNFFYSYKRESFSILTRQCISEVFIGCFGSTLRSLLIPPKERHGTMHNPGGTYLGPSETDPKRPKDLTLNGAAEDFMKERV